MRTAPARGLPPRTAGVDALAEQDQAPDRGQARPPDQHQVGRAPQRDVLAKEAMPEVVERKGGQGEGGRDEHEQPSQRRVPVAGEAHAGPARPLTLPGQAHRQEPGEEHAEQPGEDEVVGVVGQGPRIPALVEVDGDVPVHPEHRDAQGAVDERDRQRGPPRQPG